MLQQTQVKTVIPYFKKFIHKFPTLEALSKCKEKEILKLWEGLGYYRRARNLLATAKILVKKNNSRLPESIDKIKELPGIGDYTANALLGFVHDQPTIAIDGNVKRIFCRILKKDEKKINFKDFVSVNKKNLFNTNRNSDLVEALMEFGALVCKPREPACNKCSLKKNCKYFNSPKQINYKKKKIIEKISYDVFCYLNNKKQIALTKKNNLGFLKEFYLPEMKKKNKENKKKNWNFLNNYKNSISNKKLNINIYYKFSNTIPHNFYWHSIKSNKEFIPSFTKKILKQISTLF